MYILTKIYTYTCRYTHTHIYIYIIICYKYLFNSRDWLTSAWLPPGNKKFTSKIKRRAQQRDRAEPMTPLTMILSSEKNLTTFTMRRIRARRSMRKTFRPAQKLWFWQLAALSIRFYQTNKGLVWRCLQKGTALCPFQAWQVNGLRRCSDEQNGFFHQCDGHQGCIHCVPTDRWIVPWEKKQSFHHQPQDQLKSKEQVEASVQNPKDFRRGDANLLDIPMSFHTNENCA